MIVNISGYRFIPLQNVEAWRERFYALFAPYVLKGTIVVSPEGVNIMLAGETHMIDSWIDAFHAIPEFAGLAFKRSLSDTLPFKRLLVKIKPALVPGAVDPLREPAPSLTPLELKRWYQEGKDFVIIDTRNDYELEAGKFKNAVDMHLHEFKEFSERIKTLDPALKNKPAVLYCTGGIRCEKAAPIAAKAGFKEVYQLEGGILKYLELCGHDFYEGDCFVFDERRSIDERLIEAVE